MWLRPIIDRFFGAVGGIVFTLAILLCIAIISSFFDKDMSFLFQKEWLVITCCPLALLGAAFPKYTKWIGENVLNHLP